MIRFPDLFVRNGDKYYFVTSNGCYKKSFTIGDKLSLDPSERNVEHSEKGLVDIHYDSGEYLRMCDYVRGYLLSLEG